MHSALPKNHWYIDTQTTPGLERIYHLFDFTFDPAQDPGMRLRSEDYVFCDATAPPAAGSTPIAR
jgi:hypothetical protein